MLLQAHLDEFREAGKMEIVEKTAGELAVAIEINVRTGQKFGRNDILHTILAKKHADVFVTNDGKLARYASKTLKTARLEDFVRFRT